MFRKFPAHYLVTAILIAGLSCLIIATLKLQSIFLLESNRNTEVLNQRRIGIENYAHQQLKVIFTQQINTAITEISKIVDNPLLEEGNYFWRQRGEQRIPRPIFYRPSQNFDATKYYQELIQASTNKQMQEDWTTNQKQIWNLAQAITNDNESLVETHIRKIIPYNNQANNNIQENIVFQIAILATFSKYSKASPSLIEKLLRDNLTGEFGGNITGLQKQLLNRRHEFKQSDFNFCKDKIVELSTKNQTSVSDFFELSQRKFNFPDFSTIENNSITVIEKIWLTESQGDNLFGVKIDLTTVLEKIKFDMIQLGLIHQDDELILTLGQGSAAALNDISFEWRSENWRQAMTDSTQFDLIKRVILTAGMMITLAIIFLVWWIYRYQVRWVNSKSDFVATVSHEIRTPLSGIRLMAERLAEKLSGDERAKDYPQRIIADIDALSFLTDNILSFERLNSGKWVSHKSPFTLREIFFELERELPLFIKQEFRLEFNGDDNIQIFADPVLFKLLFSNLIKNSCLYNSQTKPTINLSWDEEQKDIIIDLRDNGNGFTEIELKNCFKPFYRGKHQRQTRGSGLGLALCKKIIELHEGKIKIISSSTKGTHFQISCKGMDN